MLALASGRKQPFGKLQSSLARGALALGEKQKIAAKKSKALSV
jgi:hypothetical protein